MWRRLFRWMWYALALSLAAVLAIQFWFVVHIWYWAGRNPDTTAFMLSRLERLREKNPKAALRQQWVPYQRISLHLKRAIIAAEDAKFLDHEGFDWEAIQKAYEKNLKKGRIVSGGSTISQQLAKNLFLSGERSWLRKGEEAVITWMLERVMSKRRILELYLNVAEWGDGVFGAEAAARYHFGLPAAALGPEQSAFLAVILPSPRRYEKARLTPYIAGRIETILARMPAAQIP